MIEHFLKKPKITLIKGRKPLSKEVDIYRTIQGDMWDGVSFKVYGTDRYSKELLKANPQYINVVIFSSGIELICPGVSHEEGSTLPPWR